MLVVPSVGASAPFASNDAPPGLCASTTMHSTAITPVFLATWTGPRPTPLLHPEGLHTNRATSRLQDKV